MQHVFKMQKSNVRVVIRTKPTHNFSAQSFKIDESSGSIDIVSQKTDSVLSNQHENYHFSFDQILHNTSQDKVYQEVATDIVKSVVDGYNGTLMVYGQTGAGKTYTMAGPTHHFDERGLIPRSISGVFQHILSRPDVEYTVRVSYLEIYNDLMFDLLAPLPTSTVPTADKDVELSILEDERGSITIRNLSMKTCNSEEDALQAFFYGSSQRAVASHALNEQSTRSHVIFTIHLQSRNSSNSMDRVISSKLHLVDLAGSERVKKTGAEGNRLKEAQLINKSLTFLEQVVVALNQRSTANHISQNSMGSAIETNSAGGATGFFIPYRSSRLTHLLKDSIGGNSKTAMVANIWPEEGFTEETFSTLRFATRLGKVSNIAKLNVVLPDATQQVKALEREIRVLRHELALKDSIGGPSGGNVSTARQYLPSSMEDLEILKEEVRRYLDNETGEFDASTIRRFKEALSACKQLWKDKISQIDTFQSSSIVNGLTSGENPLSTTAINNSAGSAHAKSNIVDGLGSPVKSGSAIALGLAKDQSAHSISNVNNNSYVRNLEQNANHQQHPLDSNISKAALAAVGLPHSPPRSLDTPQAHNNAGTTGALVTGNGGVSSGNKDIEVAHLMSSDELSNPFENKQQAFSHFKSNDENGKKMNEIHSSLANVIRNNRQSTMEISAALKQSKTAVEAIVKARNEFKEGRRPAVVSGTSFDDEMASYNAKFESLKSTHVSLVEKYKKSINETEASERELKNFKVELLNTFEKWWTDEYQGRKGASTDFSPALNNNHLSPTQNHLPPANGGSGTSHYVDNSPTHLNSDMLMIDSDNEIENRGGKGKNFGSEMGSAEQAAFKRAYFSIFKDDHQNTNGGVISDGQQNSCSRRTRSPRGNRTSYPQRRAWS